MDNINKKYPVCTLENVLSSTMQNVCTYIKYSLQTTF